MSAKDIYVQPVAPRDAHLFVRTHHYSGKSVNNSQLHLGAFIGKRLVGVAQFGPPMDRGKVIGLVRDTSWNGMLELNRLAMVDNTPRNTESRFLSVCMRLIRKRYPHVQWVLSFADATQCGDGTIYRAAGFVLTGIKRNTQVWEAPDGEHIASNGGGAIKARYGIAPGEDGRRRRQTFSRTTLTKAGNILETGGASMRSFAEAGFKPLPGYQLRYLYFLDPSARDRLTVPIIPFSRIAEVGAGMYKGKPRAGSIDSDASGLQPEEGGANPTPALHEVNHAT